jgi:hypothetical protein
VQSIPHSIVHHILLLLLLLHLLGMHSAGSLLLGSVSVTPHQVLSPGPGVLLQANTVLLSNLGWILGWWSILSHISLGHLVPQLKETLLVNSVVALSNIGTLYIRHLTPVRLSGRHQHLLLLLLLSCHLGTALV